jgi:hypothetical protein
MSIVSKSSIKSNEKPQPIRKTPECLEFELRLMELAVLGQTELANYWNNNGHNFSIGKHVLCYKIYEEISAGRYILLLDRGKCLIERLEQGEKSSRTRAFRIYRDILQIQRTQNEAHKGTLNEIVNIDSLDSIHVGKETSSKKSEKISSRYENILPSTGSVHWEFDEACSSSVTEKQFTRTDLPFSSNDMLTKLSKRGEPSKSNCSKKGEPSNSHSIKSSERTIVYSPWREVQKTKHSAQSGEPSNKELSKRGEHSSSYSIKICEHTKQTIVYSERREVQKAKDSAHSWDFNIKESSERGEHSRQPSQNFYQVFDEVWPETSVSSNASIASTLLDSDVYIMPEHEVEKNIKRKPIDLPLEQLPAKKADMMWNWEAYSAGSNSKSIHKFNIKRTDELDDSCITQWECVEDEEGLDFDLSVRDKIMNESKEDLISEFESSNSVLELRGRIVLGKFPAGNFKHPIKWTIDRKSHEALNFDDLRRRYDVLIEGPFKKSSRGLIWNNYYGFLLVPGIILCFGKEALKRVADFRKSTVTILNEKQFKLYACSLSVGSKEITWQMKFGNREHFRIWHDSISNIKSKFLLDYWSN